MPDPCEVRAIEGTGTVGEVERTNIAAGEQLGWSGDSSDRDWRHGEPQYHGGPSQEPRSAAVLAGRLQQGLGELATHGGVRGQGPAPIDQAVDGTVHRLPRSLLQLPKPVRRHQAHGSARHLDESVIQVPEHYYGQAGTDQAGAERVLWPTHFLGILGVLQSLCFLLHYGWGPGASAS